MGQTVKNILLQCRGPGFDPWVRKIPWVPTPAFLPGEFHGEGSLVGYSPGGCKESDMAERATLTHSLSASDVSVQSID